VGRGLAGALQAGGVEIVGLHGRRAEGGVSTGALPPTVLDATVVIIAVRDPQLDGALREIGDAVRHRPTVVLHVSGSATPPALAELRTAGNAVGTFHPLVPIAEPAHARERLRGAWIGIDGDVAAMTAARLLADRLDANTLVIPAGEKARYHAAAVLASNFPAVLAAIAAELMQAAGISTSDARGAVTALLRASVANLHEGEPAAVLTGPVARGDAATVRVHLTAIADDEIVLDVYRSLSLAAVRLMSAGSTPARETLGEIEAAIRQPTR
jgi:predicted short-subunit dehydrogenase-like oxidoreductase (DUF2520 family)